MNKIYCVSYDLRKNDKDYEGLNNKLKDSLSWWHYLESTWLIYTNESASQLWNRLSESIDKDDHILIIQVTNDYQGWLPEKAWEWIRQYVGK